MHKGSLIEKNYDSPQQHLTRDSTLYVDKEFIKNNIGESLITLKAK